MNVDYGAIGQRIKQVRRSRDMTQERLAEALSVSVGYISQIDQNQSGHAGCGGGAPQL